MLYYLQGDQLLYIGKKVYVFPKSISHGGTFIKIEKYIFIETKYFSQ